MRGRPRTEAAHACWWLLVRTRLDCLPLKRLRASAAHIAVERTGGSDAPSPARLLVGSLHDDALLLCRPLALESFPSPLVLRARTRSPAGGKGSPIQVWAGAGETCYAGGGAYRPAGWMAGRPMGWLPPKQRAKTERCSAGALQRATCCRPSRALQVVASIVHERLVGLDQAIKVGAGRPQ